MEKNQLNVDFLDPSAEKNARRKTAIIAIFFALFVGLLATIGAAASYRAASRGTNVLDEVGQLPGIAEIRRLATGGQDETTASSPAKTPDGRINFLFLGVGGQGHDGPQLTDTMILGSFDTKQNRFAMLSIPRDLAYPLGNNRFEKINNLNAYYEVDHPGQGAKLTAEAVGQLLNVRIDHVVRVDFKGFNEFIDSLGGVDVTVEKSFTDNSYPTENDGYQSISFQTGPQHMNGERALEYTRSRHGNNGEGSDFARSRRQQLVIQAVKDKMLSIGTLSSPKKLNDLYSILAGHVQTDLSVWDMVSLMPVAASLDRNKITNRVLTDAPDGELVAANVNGAYMLFPRKPDWSEIRNIAANPFVTKEEEQQALKPVNVTSLEILNGTTHEGFASQVSQKLKQLGYTIGSVGNATHLGYDRTMIYDIGAGGKPEDLVRLKKMLDADVSVTSPHAISGSKDRMIITEDLAQETIKSTSTQFLIILGDSSLGLFHSYD